MHNPEHSGLSPSSLALFMSCARKFYLKKIAKVEIDPDQKEDTEALSIGKAFHKCLEDHRHEMQGVTFAEVHATCAEFLDADRYAPLIFAMLGKYRKMHEHAGLEAIACEVNVATPTFFGYIDVILLDTDSGCWWIGDMKTAASFNPSLIPTLPRHPQLNLYAGHAEYVANALSLPTDKYRGCRYRLTTKSKLVRGKTEEMQDYIGRLSRAVTSIDFIVPKELMSPGDISKLHTAVEQFTREERRETCYPSNYASCTQYFRPCEFWSKCHGMLHSQMGGLSFVDDKQEQRGVGVEDRSRKDI